MKVDTGDGKDATLELKLNIFYVLCFKQISWIFKGWVGVPRFNYRQPNEGHHPAWLAGGITGIHTPRIDALQGHRQPNPGSRSSMLP
jgi:hypothetical protein